MKIERETLVNILSSVSGGLLNHETIDQSNYFGFVGGYVVTFNENVFCSREVPGLDFEGAVLGLSMLKMLQTMTAAVVELSIKDNSLIVKGGSSRAGIPYQAEVTLPYDQVPDPDSEDYSEIPDPDKFMDCLRDVLPFVGGDDSRFDTVVVHLSPNSIEAHDNYHFGIANVETGLDSDILVRKDAIAPILLLNMRWVQWRDPFLYFANEYGLTYACRGYVEKYPNLREVLAEPRQKYDFPTSIRKAIEAAGVFSADNRIGDLITVKVERRPKIKKTVLEITGSGESGWYTEEIVVPNKTKPVQFRCSPKIINKVLAHKANTSISDRVLVVENDVYTFAASLNEIEESKQ